MLAAIWQLVAVFEDNELLIPTFTATARSFVGGFLDGSFGKRGEGSKEICLEGLVGRTIAMVFMASDIR